MGGEEEGNFASRQRSKPNGKSKNMGVTASKRPKYSHSVFVEWTRHGRESQWELTARIARPPASLYHGPPRKIWKVQGKHKYEGTGLVYIYPDQIFGNERDWRKRSGRGDGGDVSLSNVASWTLYREEGILPWF